MARIKQIINPDDLDKKDRGIFEEILSTRKGISGPFSILLNSPEIAERTAHLGSYIRFESNLPNDLKELAIIVTANEMDCIYEWEYHMPLAREAGIPVGLITIIKNKETIDNQFEDYALIVTFCRELIKMKKVSRSTFAKTLKKFGEKWITEITATVGYYLMLACVLNAFEVVPDKLADKHSLT